MAALRIACERIVAVAAGTRNDVLNAEAFNLFQLVGAGYLDEQQVRERLLKAACACGIDADYGERNVTNTINSAATAGLAQPRYYAGNANVRGIRALCIKHQNIEAGSKRD